MMKTRLESDSIGTMEVPVEAYYGVQALRAKKNFPITGTSLHPVFIKNLALIKKAAAFTNNTAGFLSKDVADAIVDELAPIQEKVNNLLKDKKSLEEIYKLGAEKANYAAIKTLRKMQKKIGLIPR